MSAWCISASPGQRCRTVKHCSWV
ncbi:hypothetical protein EAO68_30980 [Streptomyces sp. wa22]|nr:hypothetical protein EAO68_30980 [Streptomyces sp. wa22]